MPMFNYRCDSCKVEIELYVKKYDEKVCCDTCGSVMIKLLCAGRYQFKTGDFFEPYVDTDIHPEGKPIPIRSQEDFFTQCRKHGRGYRKISDKMR